MTEELKHSPLPWSYPAELNIYDAEEKMVAHGYRYNEETPANMELIVESVNNAARYKEALEEIVKIGNIQEWEGENVYQIALNTLKGDE